MSEAQVALFPSVWIPLSPEDAAADRAETNKALEKFGRELEASFPVEFRDRVFMPMLHWSLYDKSYIQFYTSKD